MPELSCLSLVPGREEICQKKLSCSKRLGGPAGGCTGMQGLSGSPSNSQGFVFSACRGCHLVSTRAPEVGNSVCGTGCILNEKQSFLSRVRSGKNRVWFSFQEMTASSPPLWLYCQILINFLSYERKQCVIKSFCRQALFI